MKKDREKKEERKNVKIQLDHGMRQNDKVQFVRRKHEEFSW